MTQSKIFSQRLQHLQKRIHEENVDLIFVKNSVDLFYLTGMEMSLGYLFVFKNKARLFVDGRYMEMASKKSPVPVDTLSHQNIVDAIKGEKKLLFEESKISYSDFLELRKICRKAKVKVMSKLRLVDDLRLIKDSHEIRLMKKSAELAYQSYQYIRKQLKPGVTESELAKLLEIYCLKNGASKMAFDPIIAFGKNSALPHYHPGSVKLKKNDIALFDLGVILDGYASDMTRVDFVGKPDPKLKEIFDVNKAAQKMALAKCRPGVQLKELDTAARRVMAAAGFEDYYVHGLGHGIGLEVHEYPSVRKVGPDRNVVLEPGMAITIEPGIYLPGRGGVRYEDTIIITQEGYVNLYP